MYTHVYTSVSMKIHIILRDNIYQNNLDYSDKSSEYLIDNFYLIIQISILIYHISYDESSMI